ncbi:TetR/AcrR family transcriptional regulator [Nocardia fluminea]|uniref:TetR/AcrR family transcriptional regulator n=1 Tax=Nocardia fluminea TaxID=134984 RepID=UPI0033C55E05
MLNSEEPAIPDRFALARRRSIRQQRLLDAAEAVFGERGFHPATMDEISQRAGVSKPILYEHFTSKLDLYLVVLRRCIDSLDSMLDTALRSDVDSQHVLHGAVAAYFDFADRRLTGWRLIFESDALSEPAVRWHVGRFGDRCIEKIAQQFVQKAGLGAARSQLLAAGLVGASVTAAGEWVNLDDVMARQDAIQAVILLCWGGLSHVPLRTDVAVAGS